MGKKIEPELVSVKRYLMLGEESSGQGKCYVIPSYQRPYSWTTEECEKLWQDIFEWNKIDGVSSPKDPYFFGSPIINCDDDNLYEIIDGQQRTITFILLLKALLLKIDEILINSAYLSPDVQNALGSKRKEIIGILYDRDKDDISASPDMDHNNYSFSLLKSESLREDNIYRNDLKTIVDGKNLDDIEDKVGKKTYKHKDNKYSKFFLNFRFFVEKINSDLPDSDKVKNFIKGFMEQCQVIMIKCWGADKAIAMFGSLNSSGMPLSNTDLVYSAMYTVSKDKGKENEFKKKWEMLKGDADDPKSTDSFDELQELDISEDDIFMQQMYRYYAKEGNNNVTDSSFRKFYENRLKKDELDPVEICEELDKLSSAWKKIYDYTTIKILLKMNKNIRYFLAVFLNRFTPEDISEDKIEGFVECLLRLFALYELTESTYSSDKRFKSFLINQMINMSDKSVSVDSIKDTFDKHISINWKNENELKEAVKNYNDNKLVFLNEYLFAKEKGVVLKIGKVDIEHIMCQSGKNKSEIMKDAGITDKEEFSYYLNMLGNKILLENAINRGLGDAWFRTKLRVPGDKTKNCYNDSDYPIAKALAEKYKTDVDPKWKKEDIDRATDEAADRIIKFIFGK